MIERRHSPIRDAQVRRFASMKRPAGPDSPLALHVNMIGRIVNARRILRECQRFPFRLGRNTATLDRAYSPLIDEVGI